MFNQERFRNVQWAAMARRYQLAAQRIFKPIIAGLVVGVMLLRWIHYIPLGSIDWLGTYRPVILDLVLHGQSPFLHNAFHSPPWVLIPLLPLMLLPAELSAVVLFGVSMAAFGFAAYKLGAKPITVALLLMSWPVINVAGNGQIDWMVPLGLLLPRPLGLFLVLGKPQVGLGIAAYWLFDSWQRGGWRQVLADFAPVGAAFVLSFAVFGVYLLDVRELLASQRQWNITFWPFSIPIGLALLVTAIRRRRPNLALVAGAFFSPYVAIYSWSVPLFGLLDDQMVMCLVLLSIDLVYQLHGWV